MNPEKTLPIENKQGLQIEHLSDSPKITTENDFNLAYNRWLKQKNVGLYDSNMTIVKDGTQFLIGPKDGTNFKEYIRVDNISLLKDFISDTTNRYYRELFSSVEHNFNVDISTKTITKELSPGVRTTQEVLTVVFQEELNQLKEDISLDKIISSTQALIGPIPPKWLTYRDNGEQKTTERSEYSMIDDEIKRKHVLGPKDDVIYQENLNILKRFADEYRETVVSIQDDATREKEGKNLPQNRDEKLQNWKDKLDYIHAQFTQIDRNVNDSDLMNKPLDVSIYNIDLPIFSSKDIKKLQKSLWVQDVETQKINGGEFNTALLKLDVADRQEFRVYLSEVIAGKDPSKEKYTPKNEQAFRDLSKTYPFVDGYINFSDKKKDWNGAETNNEAQDKQEDKEMFENIQADPHYSSFQEALAKWWIAGLAGFGLDKTNMKPEQKQFRWWIGQLAITGAAIFVGWKMLKSAFRLITGADKGDTDDKKAARRKNRAWILGPAAIIFGLQAATGEWAGGIINGWKGTEWLAGFFGKSKDNTPEQQQKTEKFQEKYGENMVGSMSIFSEMNYGDLKQVLEQRDGKMKLKKESYDAFLEKFWPNNPNEKERNNDKYTFLKDVVGENDTNGLIELSLNATGTTREDIQDDKNANVGMKEKYANVSIKIWIMAAFMETNRYARINPDRMDKLEEFLSDPNTTIDDLEDLAKDYPDMFIKEDIKDLTGQKLMERIKEIIPSDTAKQEALMIGINKFYEYMPNASKKIELIGNDPTNIMFKTYEKETTINLNDKALNGFSPSRFDSYFELFKAASLTNRIKKLCEDKTAVADKPFKLSGVWGDIEFDDAKVFSAKFDTEILSGWLRWSLKTVSPTLEKYKQDYCDYLNNTTPKFWKEAPVT